MNWIRNRLDLGGNELSGPIPGELGRLEAVVELRLDNNQLTGPIPLEMERLRALAKLDLSSNQLAGPAYPDALRQLRTLVELNVSGNPQLHSSTVFAAPTKLRMQMCGISFVRERRENELPKRKRRKAGK